MSAPVPPPFPWTFVPTPAPGERRADFFTWPDTVFEGLRWPYFALRGTLPGPATVIVAAIHGGEYPGPLGALRLGRTLKPTTLRGAVLILPLVNLPSFWARTAFVTPTDGKNLNRLFPGSATGTFGDVLAFRLLADVVQPSEAVIDLHSGDIFEALADHAGRQLGGDPAVDERSGRMLDAFGLLYAETYPIPSAPPCGLSGNATLRGKPTIFVEVGGNGLASGADLAAVHDGLVNTLRALGNLPGDAAPIIARPIRPVADVSAPVSGLWRSVVTLEQRVEVGQVLGILTDPLGAEIARVTAPAEGLVLYYMTALAVHEGEPLVHLAQIVGA